MLHDDLQPYSPVWAPFLAALQDALRPGAGGIVDRFCNQFLADPEAARVLGCLAPDEFKQFKSQQIQNLLRLSSPDLTREQHRVYALSRGRAYAMSGLTQSSLAAAQNVLHSDIRRRVDTSVHTEALDVLARRLLLDLTWSGEAATQISQSRAEALLQVTRLAWATERYADLIRGVSEILCRHDEIVGCAFGKPDSQGTFCFEFIAGEGQLGLGISDRAWRSGEIVHSENLKAEPGVQPPVPFSSRANCRSMVAIPIGRRGLTPLTVLTLHCPQVGGYASPHQKTFITQLQSVLFFACSRLGQAAFTTSVSDGMRRRWASLIREGAIKMHYQPQVDLRTGRACGAEALVRLNDGGRLIPPAEFFPVLASDDFVELYARGLDEVLSQQRSWLGRGLDIPVSINLSSKALVDLRYFSITQRALREHAFAPSRLTLEIQETDALPQGLDVAGELNKFKRLGVGLAEADLGSGHSSLTRLRQLPFDAIKIDRSIAGTVGQNPYHALRFIYQLTRLGHSLGKRVIVEGVEDPRLMEAITLLGADIVQGHVIGRAMPADELADWLGTRALALPEPGMYASSLAELARLLLWEERLDMRTKHPLAQPGLDVSGEAQRSLMAAAAAHGMDSKAYREVRQRLVKALQDEQPGLV
jgi:EAL domain-containing protein (putative c-di-GMP-specific phosphodiesterase class I)